MRHSISSNYCWLAPWRLSVLAGPALANPSILFDLKTGQVLAAPGRFKRWYPASLTKLMTAYVTFRAIAAGEVQLAFADQGDQALRRRAAEQDGLQAGLGDDGSTMR